jgi:hypothetical protein
MFKFIEQKGDSLVANERLDILINNSYFEDDIAYEYNEDIVTIGVFIFRVYENETKYKDYNCNLPLSVILKVNEISTIDNYRVLKYDKNDIIIESTTYFNSTKTASKFVDLLINSKLNVPFENYVQLLKDGITMNGVGLHIPSVIVECMVSELTRYKKNRSIPFRIALSDKKVDIKNDYVTVQIKDVARLSSVFNAISFEDMKKSLQSSIYMIRTNQEQSISPTERIVKY